MDYHRKGVAVLLNLYFFFPAISLGTILKDQLLKSFFQDLIGIYSNIFCKGGTYCCRRLNNGPLKMSTS